MIGYVPLYRKFKEWEWYDEANTMRLFVHCLITANHKDNKWRGITVKKGSFITSIGNLAHDLKLTKQNIRTALKNLQTTNEVTVQTTHHYTVINVVNWGKYAISNNDTNTPTNTPSNKQVTNDQHTPNTGLTTNNNDNNEKNVKNEDKDTKDNVPYSKIIDYLNEKVVKGQYRATTNKTRDLIKARWNEGFTFEDFKTAIDNAHKHWSKEGNLSNMKPATLFNGGFEGRVTNDSYAGFDKKDKGGKYFEETIGHSQYGGNIG